ncbi:MAG: type II toxin-antitoxin system RelE/ParE family toxin [Acidobacteria bacterium]|nr:type II toxin-antitoxin system RelE/ParE family toxin [Acidobacteriota bacterium]
MNAHIELGARAFAALEALPEKTAFDVFRRIDRLARFPEMGSPLDARYPKLKGFRQLVYRRWLRIVYEFDQNEQTVYILAIQSCKQRLPSPLDLRRDPPSE